jgi:alpha-L-rhamnosidase
MTWDSTRRRFVLQIGAAAAAPLAAQERPGLLRPGLVGQTWNARWITAPGTGVTSGVPSGPTEYGVYHFRRVFDLPAKPARFVVHVSGDNRYQLFVNGRRVVWGPARGDLFHWHFETVDLAPYLDAGRNALAGVVWNFGDLGPEAQVTLQTGFVLEGNSAAERVAGTGPNWKARRDEAYTPVVRSSGDMHGYYAIGPGDRVNAARHPWGWETKGFDDSGWPAAAVIGVAAGREASDPHSRWMLTPRTIPFEEERPQRLQKLRSADGIPKPAAFPARTEPLHVPPKTHAVLLLDQTFLTTGYPELVLSGGKDAVVKMSYAEALFQPFPPPGRGLEKNNRDEVEGKQFIGNSDEFTMDGGAGRVFRPLWWRTWRYVQLDIQTRDEALTVDDLRATYIGYPFERRARFEGGGPETSRILEVGWRTARLCAHETYMDCPYYEQLQYVGDTRIQCLISLYNSGDARLMRNAIDQINESRGSDGATMSRYPTRMEQYIPGFSLWWVGMLHDYWRYVADPDFARRMLPGVRAVLSFFEQYQKPNGSLGPLPWWRFMDWVPAWQGGNPPQEADGSSAPFDMLLAMAYGWAAELETGLGLGAMAEVYGGRQRQLRATIQELYWDAGKRLYGDTPRKQQFSQHANTLAVLAGVIGGEAARDLMVRILTAPDLAQTGLFFRFYVHVALALVGEGDRYLDLLGDWRAMLARGLTTFAENVERPGSPSRSDCHAWSASPNIEIFRTVLGVDSAAPGFARVRVAPHPGRLAKYSGSVPHPKGMVEVAIDAGAVTVTLPPGVSGEFVWRGKRTELAPGANRIAVG